MYVATLLLEDYGLLVRIDVRSSHSLMGNAHWARLTNTDAHGLVVETEERLSNEAIDDIGPHIAALIAAIQAMTFAGRSGAVVMVHCSPDMPYDSMTPVLWAANIKHRITSLATSETLQ
jgi:hypothetical protein